MQETNAGWGLFMFWIFSLPSVTFFIQKLSFISIMHLSACFYLSVNCALSLNRVVAGKFVAMAVSVNWSSASSSFTWMEMGESRLRWSSSPHMKNPGELKIAHLCWSRRVIWSTREHTSSAWLCLKDFRQAFTSSLLEQLCTCETPRGFGHRV